MSELLQAHERLANLLLRNCAGAVLSTPDKAVLHASLAELSQASAMGSSCIYLTSDTVNIVERMAEQLPWLSLCSAACTQNTAILLQGDRLYLNKFFHAEQYIENSLQVLAEHKETIGEASIAEKLAPLEHMTETGQLVILNSLRQNLSVITGGPGTGKTTIVVRVLALLIEHYHQQGNNKLNIEILAPTGKAAARVKESIVKQKTAWLKDLRGFDRPIIEAIPETSQTLQKFLGINPTTRKSRYKHNKKANADIVIVDEASMLDVMLMKELLSAIRPTTRLILLGDPYQLAPVETGNVLAQIVTAAAVSPESWLAKVCTQLTESHRFSSDSGIGKLATATNKGEVATVLRLLQDDSTKGVSIDVTESSMLQAIGGYQQYKSAVKTIKNVDTESISAVFKAFELWQVFSPFRLGKYGVEGINLAVEEALALGSADEWYMGKPIIITANDRALKLHNGDIGICLDKEGNTVCFPATEPDENGLLGYRFIKTRILPEHQLVYAMTVHKSQGSEYERCMLVVPEPSENQGNLLKREILYTAITRAKTAFMLFAADEEIESMVSNKTERMSGLLKMEVAN